MKQFDSVKVFSATMHRDREQIGEAITRWIQQNPGIEIVDKVVMQSSDNAFHCFTISLFYNRATHKSAVKSSPVTSPEA